MPENKKYSVVYYDHDGKKHIDPDTFSKSSWAYIALGHAILIEGFGDGYVLDNETGEIVVTVQR